MFPGELSEVGQEEGSEIFFFLLRCWLFLLLVIIGPEAFKDTCGLYENGHFLLMLAKLYPCSKRLEAAEGAESGSVAESGRGQEKKKLGISGCKR